MRREVARHGGRIEQVETCPHHPDERCSCRKPKPELLQRILRRQQVAPADAVMVGDSEKDLQAASAAGVRGLLVRSGKPVDAALAARTGEAAIYADLAAVVDDLLA